MNIYYAFSQRADDVQSLFPANPSSYPIQNGLVKYLPTAPLPWSLILT